MKDSIKTGEYSYFDDGSKTILNTVKDVNDGFSNATKTINDLCQADTFCGPLADCCTDSWSTITQQVSQNTSILSNCATTLTKIKANYVSADKRVSGDVSSV